MIYYYLAIGGLSTMLLIYWTLDLHYFTRMGLVYVRSRFMKKRVHILDQTKVAGLCLTTDVDYLLTHMNNARYLRELDFARADFYQRTGLYSAIQAKGGAVLQGSSTIRYRKFIRLFSIYHITSKIIYWDGCSIYMEHRFISPGDEFVRAIAICKQRLLNVDVEEIMRDLLSGEKCPGGPEAAGYTKPEIPLELLRWMESNEISSANLRNGC
uniref:Protein THEM6 n=1 Tax=Triatoma infestans TaxID=30076 RepID=A0A023F2A2_TRIIF